MPGGTQAAGHVEGARIAHLAMAQDHLLGKAAKEVKLWPGTGQRGRKERSQGVGRLPGGQQPGRPPDPLRRGRELAPMVSPGGQPRGPLSVRGARGQTRRMPPDQWA
jgi:hypothetical protein